MPRVYEKTKSRAGADRACGRCGRTIEPGERYLSWSFRFGGTHYRCSQHPPRPSELTQSKMGEVYAAIEGAEPDLASAETIEEIKETVALVAEAVQGVVEEYREAAEAFGGQGENAERADELEGWAYDLEAFDPEEPPEPATSESAEERRPPVAAEPDRSALARFDVPATGRAHEEKREVYRSEFIQLGATWAVVAYDAWFVDEDGRASAESGVTRRVKLVSPDGGSAADTSAGQTVEADYGAMGRRLAAERPPEPPPEERPDDYDYLEAAREDARELLSGCPL